MQLTSFIFNINIIVFRDDYINEKNQIIGDNFFHIVTKNFYENNSTNETPLIVLLHINNNHYQIFYYNNSNEADLKIIKNYKIQIQL